MQYAPTQIMQLKKRIEQALWNKFSDRKYVNVRRYLELWQFPVADEDWNGNEIDYHNNFDIINQPNSTTIDLAETLHKIRDVDLLLKIAFDLGIEVPSVIYGVPEIKEILETDYKNVHKTFEEAYKKLESEPDISISLTCASLEHLIRELCNDTNPCAKSDTLYDLVSHILKEYEYFPSKELNADIRNIGSGILKIAQNAETIRSQYTKDAHGSLDPKYMQDQPLYAKLIFNALTTIGLFFIGLKQVHNDQQNDDIPF